MLTMMLAAMAMMPERKATGILGFSQVGPWDVSQSFENDSCMATMAFESGRLAFFVWYPRNTRMKIRYVDKNMASLENGKEYQLAVDFVKGKKLDEGWGVRTGLATIVNGLPSIDVWLTGGEALTDFASSDLFGLEYNDKVVVSIGLEKSAMVAKELRRCSDRIIANHPIDPFEK